MQKQPWLFVLFAAALVSGCGPANPFAGSYSLTGELSTSPGNKPAALRVFGSKGDWTLFVNDLRVDCLGTAQDSGLNSARVENLTCTPHFEGPQFSADEGRLSLSGNTLSLTIRGTTPEAWTWTLAGPRNVQADGSPIENCEEGCDGGGLGSPRPSTGLDFYWSFYEMKDGWDIAVAAEGALEGVTAEVRSGTCPAPSSTLLKLESLAPGGFHGFMAKQTNIAGVLLGPDGGVRGCVRLR